MSTIDQQFVEYVVKLLVMHPEDVVVEREIDEKGVLLTLKVNDADIGRVIGRRGFTAQSLRNLLRSLGVKNNARYNLKITNTTNSEGDSEKSSDSVDDSTDKTVEKHSNFADMSRKELAELDDLDI